MRSFVGQLLSVAGENMVLDEAMLVLRILFGGFVTYRALLLEMLDFRLARYQHGIYTVSGWQLHTRRRL